MKLAVIILSLTLPIAAQTFGSTVVAPGCGGANLSTIFTPQSGGNARIEVRGEGLHPNSFAGMVFGLNTASIGPILGNAGCFVGTDPIWAQHHQTDAAGTMSWSRVWPHSAVGYYLIQVGSVDFDTLEVKISPLVRAAHE